MPGEQPSVGPQTRQYLSAQIEPDEQVLWLGTTNVSGRMRRLLPLGITSIFMLVLCSIFSLNNPSWPILLLLSVLIWGGIPAFVAWRQSSHLRRTLYAITDRRALILSVGEPRRTESYPPERIEFVRPVLGKGGRGDLYFTTMKGTGLDAQRFDHGFLDIADVEQVASLIHDNLVRESPQREGSTSRG
jgi:hypothetical protein